MSKEYWSQVRDTAVRRLVELREKRDALDAQREEVNFEIVQLEQVVSNLTPLVDIRLKVINNLIIPNAASLSLANACREVLKKNGIWITPIEVRDALDASGYVLVQHANPLASIHGVLKRLVESGEAEAISHDVKGTLYRLKKTGTPMPAHGAGGGSPPLVARRPAQKDVVTEPESKRILMPYTRKKKE